MKPLITFAVAVSVLAGPAIAGADPDAAVAAAIGSGAGFVRGGPVDAAAGAGVGGTVGAGSAPQPREATIVEHPNTKPVHERSCARDSLGHVMCEEAAH